MKRSLLRSSALFVLTLCVPLACKKSEERHDHASEHPEGHDHHAEDHGHGESPIVRITRFSERFELFAEHPAAVTGTELTLLAHVTLLDGFRPLATGKLRIELDGPSQIRAGAPAPKQPGIYQLNFKAGPPGKYTGKIVIDGPSAGTISGIELVVYENESKAKASVAPEHAEGVIEFLKEQQWNVPFATAFTERGVLVPTIEVAGRVDTPPGGSAEVGAPVVGRLTPLAKGLPKPGDSVKKGQILAMLAPAPASPEDAARATLSVSEASARSAAARTALERAERLIKDAAISERELEDARRELEVAEQGLRAAKRVEAVFSGASAGSTSGTWKLTAPISGTLTEVNATPGATVSVGTALFRIVDARQLWIFARVPEQDAAKLRADRNASFRITGSDTWHTIDLSNEEKASIVTVGRTVDKLSRTVEVIYALHDPDPGLRVGGSVRVSLPAGPDFEGVIVPRSAIVDDEGREVVYVQVDGEHFKARPVRSSAHAGARTGLERGLAQGERVVTRGAHLVRLADRSKSTEAHGHIH